MKTFSFLLFLTTLLSVPGLAFAQVFDDSMEYAGALLTGPHFLIAVVAGVVLALAFQFVLTNVSVAAGVSAVKIYPRHHEDSDDDGSSISATGITSGIGLWALLTASIALFFASWLAVELALAPSILIGVVLGLVVWGLFYLAMIFFEATAMASLAGAVTSTALAGLRSSYGAVTSMFGKSTEDKAADAASSVVHEIEREFARNFGSSELRDVLDQYVDRISKPAFEPKDIRREIEKLLENVEFRSVAAAEGPGFLEIDSMIGEFERHGKFDERTRHAVKSGIEDAFRAAKEEARSHKDPVEKTVDAAMRMSGMSAQEAQQMRQRFERYLLDTHVEQLNPDAIKRDIALLVRDPAAGREAISHRLSSIDRETVTTLLAQRQDIDRAQAEKIVDRIMRVVGSFRQQVGGGAEGVQHGAQARVEETRQALKNSVRDYLAKLDQPTLNYEALEHDVSRVFHGEAKEGLKSLQSRIESLDHDAIVDIVSSNPRIDHAQAERAVSSIERARDKARARVTEYKLKAERKMKEAKIAARKQAEEGRKVAATAAWWAVATAVASGFAAALGGVAAVATGM